MSDTTYVPLDTLYAIESADPAGWFSRQPTAADYASHERWARDRYGDAAWRAYRCGGWAPTPDV